MSQLHAACLNPYFGIDAVRKMLSEGADVNVRDEAGETPLHIAVFLGKEELIKLLLEHGADVHARGQFNKTPLDIAKEQHGGKLRPLLDQHANKIAQPPANHDQIPIMALLEYAVQGPQVRRPWEVLNQVVTFTSEVNVDQVIDALRASGLTEDLKSLLRDTETLARDFPENPPGIEILRRRLNGSGKPWWKFWA